MNETADLLELLERRLTSFGPERPEVLGRVMHRVQRRRRWRGGMASAVAVTLVSGLVVGARELTERSGARPSIASAVVDPLVGTVQSLAVRQAMGIQGSTKGAPDSVLVRQLTADGTFVLKLVEMKTGAAIPVDLPGDVEEASVSPRGDAVAGVSKTQLVVTTSKDHSRTETIPDTIGAEGPVSWAPGGTALFLRVRGGWVRVSSSIESETPRLIVQSLQVPKLPGGPMLLSVSPTGREAILFGVAREGGRDRVPHLYVGRFNGLAVTDIHSLVIPSGAIDGPMGWVGDNAFLLAPAPNQALIVRTDGNWTLVEAQRMADPCSFVPDGAHCVSEGPWLLGTNADGSLLFWRLEGLALPHVSDMDALVTLYVKTWLDGTHPARLTGLAGRYGPPVAPK